MGNFCGWSGMGPGSDMSQQAIKAMFKACGGISNNASHSHHDHSGALGIGKGIHATNFLYQDGIRIALI